MADQDDERPETTGYREDAPRPELDPREDPPEPHVPASGLDTAATLSASGLPAKPRTAPRPMPATIGSYRVLGRLGEGGMGVVWEAEQQQPRRRVALKVLRQGHLGDELHARMFHREAETLGRLKHPNIAAIYESGHTEDGRDYFAMELVAGVTLGAWLERRPKPVTPQELELRLRLFRTICDAVHYAHQRGVIHRDLKPGNIVVTDGVASAGGSTGAALPAVKILDFGLARVTDADVPPATLLTEVGMIKGTLAYMAPEQARGDVGAIDVRTDIYALGVVLYELLAGRRPYEVMGSALAEAVRVICEEPPRSLSQGGGGTRKLDQDLETIVGKALEKEPERRYGSAAALAEDVERYLTSQPITARPPSRAYRARKFVQRHRVAVVAGGLVVAALLAGLAGTMWQARESGKARRRAELIAGFMSEILEGVGPSVAMGRDTAMLEEMMDTAAARIEKGELRGAPEAELRLRETIGTTYTELALYAEAAKMLEGALTLARSLHGGDHPDVANALDDVANLLEDRGDGKAAEPLYRESLAMFERLFPGDHVDVATGLNNLGSCLQDRGELAEAEPLLRRSLAMRRRLFPGDDTAVAESLNNLASLYMERDDLAAAEPLLREALAIHRRLFPGNHPRVAGGLNNLGVLLEKRGDFAGAEPLHRESLEMRRRLFPGDHPQVATALNNLALVLEARDDVPAAEALYRESLAMRRRLYPGDHMSVATDLNNLAGLLRRHGDLAGAEPLYREAAGMYERTNGKDFWPTGNARLGLGRTLTGLGRFAEAERDLLEAERVFSTAQGVSAKRRQQGLEALVTLYESWQRAAPGEGHGARAADWKGKLQALGPPAPPAPR